MELGHRPMTINNVLQEMIAEDPGSGGSAFAITDDLLIRQHLVVKPTGEQSPNI